MSSSCKSLKSFTAFSFFLLLTRSIMYRRIYLRRLTSFNFFELLIDLRVSLLNVWFRMMNDYKVEMIGDELNELHVEFHGPKESTISIWLSLLFCCSSVNILSLYLAQSRVWDPRLYEMWFQPCMKVESGRSMCCSRNRIPMTLLTLLSRTRYITRTSVKGEKSQSCQSWQSDPFLLCRFMDTTFSANFWPICRFGFVCLNVLANDWNSTLGGCSIRFSRAKGYNTNSFPSLLLRSFSSLIVTDLLNVFDTFLPMLLREPNPSDPLNRDAASLMMTDKQQYGLILKGDLCSSRLRLTVTLDGTVPCLDIWL